MAYKFQLGAAVLSGSIKAEDGLVSTDVDDTTAANIVAQIDAGEIPIAKLAANTISGKSLGNNLDSLSVGATSGLSMSSYNGSAAVSDLAVSLKADSGLSKDANGVAISLASNKALEFDSGALAVKVKSNSGITQDSDGLSVNLDGSGGLEFNSGAIRLEAAVAGDGLAHNSGVLSVGVDDSSIEINSDSLRIKETGVTNAMLAGSIANAKLANSAITVGGSAISLGGTIAGSNIAAALNSDLGGAFTIGNQSDDVATFSGGVVVAGNLTVQGASVEVQQGFVVTSSVQFEGSTPDGNEISLTSADPSADRTITLPDLSGHVPLIAGAIGNANVTSAEFLLLDGGSSVGTTALADADGFLHNDNGTMKQTQVVKIAELAFSKISGDATVSSGGALTIESDAIQASMLNDDCISGFDDIGAAIVGTDELLISDGGTLKRADFSRLKTYIGSGTAAVNVIGDENATLAVGLNAPSAAASAPRTWTLPASSGLSAGESIVIKAYGNSGTHPITIALVGSQEIDGSTANIVLESDNAAVTLHYVAADTFIIV